MRERIVQTKITKPAKLKYSHPVGTPVTVIDFYINHKGERTFFTWPKVDGLYFERAKEIFGEATEKRKIVFQNRGPVNPKDLTQGQAFLDKDEVFNFFSLASEGIILLFGAVEALINSLIENIQLGLYSEKKYTGVVKLGNWRLQRRKHVYPTKEQVFFRGIEDKLKNILPICYGIESPVKKDFWASFCLLKKLRDGIMHPTRSKTYGADKEKNSVLAELFEIDFMKLVTDTESLLQYLEENCKETVLCQNQKKKPLV